MTITSYNFWLLFLPILLLIYWLVFRKPRQKLWFLCIASYLFYALADIRFLPILLILSLLTFWIGRWGKYYWIGIVLNLGALLVYKYWDFGIQNIYNLLAALGGPIPLPVLRLALPLGISFYVFKHIGYLVDMRQKLYPPASDFLVFTTFSAFFPQISAGPISSFQQTGEQLASLPTRLSTDFAYQGVLHISIGLAKKLLIADVLSSALQTQLFTANANSGMLWGWLSVVIFAIQLYFDFSGYTDIVLGVGYLLGVTLPPNFNNPYLAKNPRDFWQRWHISLSNWFRFYLFTPLSRGLLRRWGLARSRPAQYTANLVTMGLVGFWHGANWGYLLWGLYHGMLLNVTAAGQRARFSLPALVSRALFLLALLIGWALFLSPDFAFAQNLLGNMAGLHGIGDPQLLLESYPPYILAILLLALSITLSGMAEAASLPPIKNPVYLFCFGVVLVLCLLRIDQAREFLYAQF
jgi:alginate O-acetyltransferase complex protein AlgI